MVSEISSRVRRFDFVSANTDNQALRTLPKKVRSFLFGQDLTGGLGCGMDPDLGERAAKAEKDRLKRLLEGSDVCIFMAALGGGTGSGAVATFAEVAQELHILCVGIFTLPFAFEGEKRKQIAENALEKVKPLVNAYVVIPNEYIFRVIDQKTPLKEALSAVNRRLANTLEGFMETIVLPGLINIDFADVRSTLEGRGRLAFVNSAEATGATKAQEVVQEILVNPLYNYTIHGADRMLFNVTGDRNLKMQEVAYVSSSISQYNPRARIIFGIACNSRAKDRLRVTLFAVGCDETEPEKGIVRSSEKMRARRKKKKYPVVRAAVQAEGKKEEERIQETSQKSSPESPTVSEKEHPNETQNEQKPSAQRSRVRRNALDVKKATDAELKELEKKEKQWDIPAFLRNKS